MLCELISFHNDSGLKLDGLLFRSLEKPIATVIHIHGSFGNFYNNDFIKSMANIYCANNINFVTFNLTAHDGIAESVREINGVKSWEYVGYSISEFQSCIDDINGAIRFANKFGVPIILQGHSLGCDRIIYYFLKSGRSYDSILLSPSDQKNIQEEWIYPETISEQIARLKFNQDTNFLLPFSEYGVKTTHSVINDAIDNCPFIPISKKALLSLLESECFTFWSSLRECNFYYPINVFIYIGGKDEYNSKGKELVTGFNRNVRSLTLHYIEEGNHHFQGFETPLYIEIISWIHKVVS